MRYVARAAAIAQIADIHPAHLAHGDLPCTFAVGDAVRLRDYEP